MVVPPSFQTILPVLFSILRTASSVLKEAITEPPTGSIEFQWTRS